MTLPIQIADLTPEQRELLVLRMRRAGRADRRLPLSSTQEQLWFLDSLSPVPRCTTCRSRSD